MGFENTNIHPNRFAITIPTSTMPSIERVEVYQTNNPEFYADPNPRLMASVETPNQNSVDIDLADCKLRNTASTSSRLPMEPVRRLL